MTTEYMTWLETGILGKSWNFGCLDGTQAVRSWPVPHQRGGGGGGGVILLQYVFAFVCVVVVVVGLRDILRELTQNNDRFTTPHQAGSHVAKIKQETRTVLSTRADLT